MKTPLYSFPYDKVVPEIKNPARREEIGRLGVDHALGSGSLVYCGSLQECDVYASYNVWFPTQSTVILVTSDGSLCGCVPYEGRMYDNCLGDIPACGIPSFIDLQQFIQNTP